MTQHEVARTLVKSAPELWEVCSDPDSLSRHLEAFGEIRITRVEPESTVAWEGERASGTVRIEPSGWGTRVILTATPVAGAAEPEPEDEVAGLPEVKPAEPPPGVLAEPGLAVADASPPVAGPAPAVAEPAPVVQEPETAPARPGFFRRLRGILFRSLVTPVEIPDAAFAAAPADEAEADLPEPEARLAEPAPIAVESEPARVEPAPVVQPDTWEVLQAMLSRLGSDHHRPYSRT